MQAVNLSDEIDDSIVPYNGCQTGIHDYYEVTMSLHGYMAQKLKFCKSKFYYTI